ncbi:MAG: ABC transporter ATP-binding protein [Treponema sp.]
MNEPILALTHVYKTFQSEADSIRILNDLNLTIEQPAKIAVIGESGCGKSTFLNIVGGLENADSGSIIAGGYELHRLNESALTEYRRFYLGFIFQFHYLLKDFTALENVMLPGLIAGMPKKAVKEKARSLLRDVKLENRQGHFPSQLSGGERQRAAVARALINDPSLILADEPTGNLDPANAHGVQELLFSIADKHRKTLIIVTHDQGIAANTDLCYRLEKGRLNRV